MQHPEPELLTNMSKQQVRMCQWDYIINSNKNLKKKKKKKKKKKEK